MKTGILSVIGDTPLIQLKKLYPEEPLRLYAKLEMFNPGGSIKDRPAAKIIADAIEAGNLDENSTIIESSSGNMAIGLALVCRYYGLNLIVVVDPKINRHTLSILKTYGAYIEQVSKPDEDGNYLNARLQRVQELLDEIPGGYWPNQYANDANPASHYTTMAEITAAMSVPPDYLFASTSTCGTIMGCAKYVRDHNLKTKIIAVDAVGSVIFGTSSAERLVPGHGAGRPSVLLQKDLIDHVVHIDDKECITGCHRLLNREAILAGGSSGAVISAVEKLTPEIPGNVSCALILPDSGERYLDTIYNEGWLQTHFGESISISGSNAILEKKKEHSTAGGIASYSESVNGEKNKATQKIAIIGGGPKGMYGFERLAAQFNAHPVDHNIEVHVYNKSSHFGAGEIYNPKQPDYLIINNPIGDINMWIDEEPAAVTPETLSLTKWLQKKKNLNVTEKDYVSRALVGQYLEKGFEAIASQLPEGVNGKYISGEVIDIRKEKGTFRIKIASGPEYTKELPHKYNHILLATGHPKNKLTEKERAYQQLAQQNDNMGFVPFIYPVGSNLQDIAPGSRGGIKGIGLTFVDAALALTEGRGGTFERSSNDGTLRYITSGREPKVIFPFSRSGLPMIPRGPAPENAIPLKFFTDDALTSAKCESPGNKLDFKSQVLPLLYEEMIYAFYNIQMKNIGFKDDLQDSATYAEIKHYVDLFHELHPKIDRFDPALFLNPLGGPHFQTSGSSNSQMMDYLRFFLGEAKKGELKSPWAAVSAVWRKATPVFAKFYAFGGLQPGSQLYFDTTFRRLLNRVTFGPPIENGEKIGALLEAGILNFQMAHNTTVKPSEKDAVFVMDEMTSNKSQTINYLIDARIPNVSIENNQSVLYRNLKKRGFIKHFTNECNGSIYQPGCAAISQEGFAIWESGDIDPAIAITGTPTEGVTFDNDTLSRTRNNFVSNWAAVVRKSCAWSPIKYHSS